MTNDSVAAKPTHGVHSEVGRLRKVLVCAPGLVHRRLTPTNADALLFDDVMWVDNAQRDTQTSSTGSVNETWSRRAARVLTQAMAIPEAASWLLDRKIIANQVGIGRIDSAGVPGNAGLPQARGLLDRRPRIIRPAGRVPNWLSRPGPGVDRRPRVPHAATPSLCVRVTRPLGSKPPMKGRAASSTSRRSSSACPSGG